MCAAVLSRRAPTFLALLAILPILAPSTSRGNYIVVVLPPTLSQIQDAITDSSAGWTAGANTVWNQTWTQKRRRLGCLDSKGSDPGTPLSPLRDIKALPSSLDWRNNNGTNYISSVKDQDTCGSCWSFAACGVVEALRKINGQTACGFDDLSEQFIVSCDPNDLGCDGGYPDKVANFFMNTGAPDEACFAYAAEDSALGTPCSQRCNDWSSRLRKIASWSWVHNGLTPSNPGAVDTLKAALQNGPLFTTMRVPYDFFAYKSGVYRHVIGPVVGGHAVLLVGYDDANSCFIIKNSWGPNWGENGFFRVAYSQCYNRVRFGNYTVSYSTVAQQGGGFSYGHGIVPIDWLPGMASVGLMADNAVYTVTPSFGLRYFCNAENAIRVSTNGWMGFGSSSRDLSWPDHYPIPSPLGPASMVAPLWTDLDPAPGGNILTQEMPDGRYVIEYRNVLNKSSGTRETFETIFYDPVRYPTPTGDAMIRFQYQQHTSGVDYYTTGIENKTQQNGEQVFYNGLGVPASQGMGILFSPIQRGDEDPPLAPVLESITYSEPLVQLSWTNPTQNERGFPLLFLTDVCISRDGEAIAAMAAEPGAAMSYDDRDAAPGVHEYSIRAYAGDRVGAAATGTTTVPERRAYADHANGNVRFTITDQGICGFQTAGTTQGSGFLFPATGSNLLWIGSLWAATDSLYALNRDYVDDPYADWMFWNDVEGPTTGVSDSDYRSVYDDGGHAYPKGLRVRQDSWSWSSAPNDDFVILRYTLTNTGSEAITGLYVGQFMDWDIGTDPWHNQGGTDPLLRMAYMWHGTGLPYAGVALLDTLPDDPPLANLSLIHNPTYVYPHTYLLDSDRVSFLKGSDPAHSVPVSTSQDDWGTIASAGPYNIPPEGVVRLAFVAAGGSDLADLQANVRRAYLKYRMTAAGIEDETAAAPLRLDPGHPNPFRESTTISYRTPGAGRVKICVYDASGRLVRSLIDTVQPPGSHAVVWDGRDEAGRYVPSGVYFYRLAAAGGDDTRRLVVIR